jgi:hypothetical protein
MIGGDGIVEHAKSEALLRLEKPVEITAPVARKLEDECLSVAVSYVPDVTRQGLNVLVKRARLPNTNHKHESRSCL